MDGGNVKSRAHGERGDGDLALGGGERLEQIEGAVDRLHGAPCALRRDGGLFRFAQHFLYYVKAYALDRR